MPKADKNPEAAKLTGTESAYTMMPWSCNHYPTYSEIEAYVPITGDWEIIADIHDTRGVDAEIVAGLIARAVNGYDKSRAMIAQMTAAIELCLECRDCLTWEAEQEAQAVLNQARRIG
jgi:hypothetical protein